MTLIFAVSTAAFSVQRVPKTQTGKNQKPKTNRTISEPDSSEFRVYQPRLVPAPTELQELQADLALILDSPDLTNAHVGVSVIRVEDSKELFKYNSLKNFVPASVNKLYVTAGSLKLLGSDYRYHTDLYLAGDLALDGRFIGDIIIKGSGDPTLSKVFYEDPTVIFDDWIQQLQLLGVKSIVGNIIGDDDFFDDDYYAVGWDYKDLKEPFAAQVNALSIFENKVDITVIPSDSLNQSPSYALYPETEFIEVGNYLSTVRPSERSFLSIVTSPHSNSVELYGNIYTRERMDLQKEQIAISDPTLFFLELFRQRMDEYEIYLEGEIIDIDDLEQDIDYSSLEKIEGWTSPPIKDIVKEINKASNNLVAEMLLKTLAREKTGVGSFENGTQVLADFLVSMGINPSMIVIKDGSGLSRNNLISPYGMARFLQAVYQSNIRADFMASLAKPGEKGTLQNRLIGSEAEKRVTAKTGSMNNVSTLAGYIKTKNNKTLAFCIMVNNFTEPISVIRNIQDLMVMRLASFSG